MLRCTVDKGLPFDCSEGLHPDTADIFSFLQCRNNIFDPATDSLCLIRLYITAVYCIGFTAREKQPVLCICIQILDNECPVGVDLLDCHRIAGRVNYLHINALGRNTAPGRN